MIPTNSYGIIGAKSGVSEDNATYDGKSISPQGACFCGRSNVRFIDRIALIYAVSHDLNNFGMYYSRPDT